MDEVNWSKLLSSQITNVIIMMNWLFLLSSWNRLWWSHITYVLYQITIPTNNRGYVLFVYVLVKPYNITCIIQVNKQTPLHIAVMMGHTDVVSLLVGKGANVNMKNEVS